MDSPSAFRTAMVAIPTLVSRGRTKSTRVGDANRMPAARASPAVSSTVTEVPARDSASCAGVADSVEAARFAPKALTRESGAAVG